MTALSDDEIMELAGSWFYTGENQKRDDGYYYRSLGTPSNVRGSDLIEFARALLAAQPAVQQPAEDAPQEAKDAYVARVAMLRAHAKRAKLVTEDEVLEIASMDADELRRRAIVQRDWHRLFASCLDGLPLAQYSGTPDGCWDPAHIRRVVELLLAGSAIKAQGGKQ